MSDYYHLIMHRYREAELIARNEEDRLAAMIPRRRPLRRALGQAWQWLTRSQRPSEPGPDRLARVARLGS